MNAWPRRPREPEEADREPETAYHGRIQPMFRRYDGAFPVLPHLLQVEHPIADYMRGDCKHAADGYGEEGQARLGGGEVVDGVVD